MAEKAETVMGQIRGQLTRELQEDVPAVAAAFRAEFEDGTVELEGEEATQFLQQSWLQGKGLRNVDEIDRIGAKKWWENYFKHVGTFHSDYGKEVFFAAIESGMDYVQAVKVATVLGGMQAPPQPAQPSPMGVMQPPPMMEPMPPPMPPEMMAPIPPQPMPMPEPVPMDPGLAMPPPMPGVV
jgi:hypothetical protein